jgi:hypothetical protein
MKIPLIAFLFFVLVADRAFSWSDAGHSVVGEVAQERLNEQAATVVRDLLEGGTLASVAAWADDYRATHPETSNWHYVNIPVNSDEFDRSSQCAATLKGDCIIVELERLRNELRCAPDKAARANALRFATHFMGDIHQPLHTIEEKSGGNLVDVAVYFRGARDAENRPTPVFASNLHSVWDQVLIEKSAWTWGGMRDLVKSGWLESAEAKTPGIDGGTPVDWALETHRIARDIYNKTPANFVIDRTYYDAVLPVLERQLGVAGLRLARFLNDAYSSSSCPVP